MAINKIAIQNINTGQTIEKDIGAHASDVFLQNGTSVEKAISDIIAGGGGSSSAEGDNLYPKSLTLTKTKTTYNQDEEFNINDLTVSCLYTNGTSKIVTYYSTNADKIDTAFPGYKILTVTYCHNGITVEKTIGITVVNTDSYNQKQLAYKVAKSGLLINGTVIAKSGDKIYQYGRLKFRLKVKFVVEVNESTSNVTLGFGEYGVWGNATLGDVITLKPKQIGEFLLDTTLTFDYNHSSTAASTDIFTLKNSGGTKIQGYFELQDISLTYVEEVAAVPTSISATKVQTRSIIGEQLIIDDITATVTYNTGATEPVTPVVTPPAEVHEGDNSILVEYSKSGHTVSTTITIHYYKADKTTPDPFVDMTSWQWCQAWKQGINWGNELDSKANSKGTIPGDTSHKGDNYMNQETAWGQPVATLKNFQDIKAKGFDMVRIPITWCYNSYTEPERDANGLLIRHIGKYWACRAREVVDLALEAGLYVLINMHHEQPIIFTNSSYAAMQQVYKDAENCWLEIAEKFKHYDQRLSFEGYNEVDNLKASFTYDDTAADQMNILNQIFVTAVRSTGSNNTYRVLHCPTTIHQAGEKALARWTYPEDIIDNHIVLNIHRYAHEFLQDLEFSFSTIEKYSNIHNVPICIGEWGETSNFGSYAFRAIHAQNYTARARYHNLYPIVWDNGSDYELVKKYNRINEYNHSFEDLQKIIDGIMTGYNTMVAYKIPDDQIKKFNSLDDYTLLWWNASKGYYNSYWGSATTYIFPVPPGRKYIISTDRTGLAVDHTVFPAYVNWLKSTTDDQGNVSYTVVLSEEFKWHTSDKKGTVPMDADCGIILSNSSDENCKVWDQILKNGDYCLNLTFYSDSDISEDPLTFRTPSYITTSKEVTNYIEVGSEINTDDITVQVVYNDGFVRTLNTTEYSIDMSGVDNTRPGVYNIIINTTVEGISFTSPIEIIVGKLLASITSDTTLSSKVGTPIVTTGVLVIATYSDESVEIIDSGFILDTSLINTNAVGTYNVTVSYTENDITRTCIIPYEVYDKLLISDIAAYDKTTYTIESKFTYSFEKPQPEIIKLTAVQRYMYPTIITDADEAYLNILKTADNTKTFEICIPNVKATAMLNSTSSNGTGTATTGSNHIYNTQTYIDYAKSIITDSQSREWIIIKGSCSVENTIFTIISASIPFYYVGYNGVEERAQVLGELAWPE